MVNRRIDHFDQIFKLMFSVAKVAALNARTLLKVANVSTARPDTARKPIKRREL